MVELLIVLKYLPYDINIDIKQPTIN